MAYAPRTLRDVDADQKNPGLTLAASPRMSVTTVKRLRLIDCCRCVAGREYTHTGRASGPRLKQI